MGDFRVEGPEAKKLLKIARRQPLSFAFNPAKADEDGYFALHRKKQPAMLGKEAKKEGEGTKFAFGTAKLDGKILSLTCDRELPALAKKMKRYLKSQKVMVNVQVLDASGNILDSEIDDDLPDDPDMMDEAAEGSDDTSGVPSDEAEAEVPAPDRSAEDLVNRLKALRGQIQTAPPSAREKLGPVANKIVELIRASDFDNASSGMDKLEQALATLPKSEGSEDTEAAQKLWEGLEAQMQPKVEAALKAGKGDLQKMNAVWAFAIEKSQAGEINSAKQALAALEKLFEAANFESGTQAQKDSGQTVSDTLTSKELIEELKARGADLKAALGLMPSRVEEGKKLIADVQKGVKEATLDMAREAMDKINALIADGAPIDAAKKQFKLSEGRISSRSTAMQDLPPDAPGMSAPLAAYRSASQTALDAADTNDWIAAQAALPAWESALDTLEAAYRQWMDAQAEFKIAKADLTPRTEAIKELPPEAPGASAVLAALQSAEHAAVDPASRADWIAAAAAVAEWRNRLQPVEEALATFKANKAEFDSLEQAVSSDLASALKLGAVTPAMGTLCSRMRDQLKTVRAASNGLDYENGVPAIQELTTRVNSLLEARKTYVAERADWGAKSGAVGSKIASVEGCGPLDATLDSLKATFDAALLETRNKAKANDYAGAIEQLKDVVTKADAFLAAKGNFDTAREQVFDEARDAGAADIPAIPTDGRDDGATVLGVETAMSGKKGLAKSKGLQALLDEARSIDQVFAKAMADADPAIVESVLPLLVGAASNCEAYLKKNKNDKDKVPQGQALSKHFSDMAAEATAAITVLKKLSDVDPKAVAGNEANALKAIGALDAIKASAINPAAKAIAEKKRRDLVAMMMKTAVTPNQIREVAAKAGGDFKESYDRQMAMGSLSKTSGESRTARDHDSTRIQPAADAANVDQTRRLAGRLITDDGRLELAALYACNPEDLAGDSPSSRQTVRALTRLREDPEAIEILEAIEAPKKDSPSAKMICATLGLPADTEVTEAQARQAALSSLMAELRQKDVGSCFATQVAINIHDTDPKRYLKDISDLLSKGVITRTVNGETLTVPIETNMSDAALETNTIKLSRSDDPILLGSSNGGDLDPAEKTHLEEAPAFQAAFETLGVGQDDREAAMAAALKTMQQSDEFKTNQNEKALYAAVANISDDDMRDKVFKTAMAQLEVNSGNVKAALQAAMNTEGVPSVDPVNDGDPANEATAALGAFDTVDTADEIDVEPGLVVRQIVMDKVGLTEAEIAKQNEYEAAAAKLSKDTRPNSDPDRKTDLAEVERLQKECASIRPKIQEMEALKAACYDAFTGGEDNRLLRAYEYTLTAFAEQNRNTSSMDEMQEEEHEVLEEVLDDLWLELANDPAIIMSDDDLDQIGVDLFDRYQLLFKEGTQYAYAASILADEVAADGNSDRGGFYLYDVRGISNPANWIKIDDPKKYQALVKGTMMLAWKEIYENEDAALRETSRFVAEKMGEKVASDGFVNQTVEKAKNVRNAESAKPWEIQEGGFSTDVLRVLEEREPTKKVIGTPTDSGDLMKKIGTQLKGIWDSNAALKEAADKDPETATVNASNKGVHAYSLTPGEPRLRAILESDNPGAAIDAFQNAEQANWNEAMTATVLPDQGLIRQMCVDAIGDEMDEDDYDDVLASATAAAGSAEQITFQHVKSAIRSRLVGPDWGISEDEADEWLADCGETIVENLIPPIKPAELQAKLEKVARALKVPDDMVVVVVNRAKEALDLKDATMATMTDIKSEVASAMAAEGMDSGAVSQVAVNDALRDPAGLIFADSNWGSAEHRIKYAMVVNPMSGEMEMWQMNEDGSDAEKMDEDEWVKKEWSAVT